MNKQRRAQLQKVVNMIADARELLEEIRDDEQEAFDNLPIGIQESERGEQMDSYVYLMGEIIDSLDDHECNLTDDIIEG